jgi:hypothetical protein
MNHIRFIPRGVSDEAIFLRLLRPDRMRPLKKSDEGKILWSVKLQLDLKPLENEELSNGSPKGEHSKIFFLKGFSVIS